MKMNLLIAMAAILAGTGLWAAEADIMQRLQGGAVLEFPAGSDIPLTLAVEGDVLETRRNETVAITVKKKFWLKLKSEEMQLSFDGVTYKPLQAYVGGTISVGINQDGEAEVRLQNHLK